MIRLRLRGLGLLLPTKTVMIFIPLKKLDFALYP